jgi:hypothetical protein
MKIRELSNEPRIKLLTQNKKPDAEFASVYVCDLLSAVLARAGSEDIWVTIQAHKNILGVAAIKNIPAIIITEGNKPDAETLMKAGAENITIFGTDGTNYQTAVLIHEMLKKGSR